MATKFPLTKLNFPFFLGSESGDAPREEEKKSVTSLVEDGAKRRSDRPLGGNVNPTPNVTPLIAAMPEAVGAGTVALGILVLLGWLLEIEPLKSVYPGLEAMKPITAFTFILSGVALYLRAGASWSDRLQRTISLLILVILAIALVSLLQFTLHANLYVGEYLITLGWPVSATNPMSVVGAVEFTLFGMAMVLPQRGRRSDLTFVALTLLGLLISLLVFAGYLYQLRILYAPVAASSIALHTAIACFMLFVGAAMTRPHTGWVALLAPDSVTGTFAQWLLPGIVILPIALGWLLNQAVKNSILTAGLGVELFALSSVLFLAVVVWRTGVIANRLGRHIELREQLEARLHEARIAAQEATMTKSDFLANMSHELRTPLNSIIGFAGLLAKSQSLRPADRRYVEIIDGSTQSLLALVNDILDFSSLEAGGVTLHPAPFSLVRLVERVAASFSLIAREKRLTLKVEGGSVMGAAHFGDEMRIRQVLVNLVNNAVKFTSKGSVTIAVSATDHSKLVQDLRIEVRDTGIGIAPQKLKALFGRFAQADASIHNRFGGTGLGLAISKQLIELMGGEIGVESVEGKGTTLWLTLTLPRADPAALHGKGETLGPVSTADGRHILVVDDVDLNRELVTALLAPLGHRVHQATDGAEAVTAVASTDYDLVLMDVQMPGMDGLTATRAIRSVDRFASLPIIAMTAQALPAQIATCHEAGMNDYLAKPITSAALLAVIDKWGGGSRSPGHAAGADQSMTELYDEFVAQCAKDLARIKSLLASGSPGGREELKRLVHRMAGTAGMLGLANVSVSASELDKALARDSAPDGTEYVQLLATLEQLVRAA